tara:strand:- start:1485 stop:2522 length:1038 start_codon:yes stop_codon:yes gene_type:complete
MNGNVQTIWVYPGQGKKTAVQGMARELLGMSVVAREVFEDASRVFGTDMRALCTKGSERDLARLAQQAVVTTSIAFNEALSHDEIDPALNDSGIEIPRQRPLCVAGLSVGQVSAGFGAMAYSRRTALLIVALRYRIMMEANAANPGTTFALVKKEGVDLEGIQAVCDGFDRVAIALVNEDSQVVIGGPNRAVAAAARRCVRLGYAARSIPLKTQGAFHNRELLGSAAEIFTRELTRFDIGDPAIPIIGNTAAQEITTGKELREELGRIHLPVQWVDTMGRLVPEDDEGNIVIIEVGPEDALTEMAKRDPRFSRKSLAGIGVAVSLATLVGLWWGRKHWPQISPDD